LSQKFPFSGWCPGPGNLGQNGLKLASIMTSPTKNSNLKRPNFFIGTTRYAASLEGLNSSLTQAAGELCWCKILQKKWSTR